MIECVGLASDAIIDADCFTMATTTEAVVEEAQAVFSFSNNIDRAKICYKFGLDAYRLYKDVPIVKQGFEIVEEYLNQRADITLKLNGDLDEIPSGSAARVDFVMNFKHDISVSAGIALSRIHVTDIRRGSIIVQFVIDPVPIGESGMLAQQAASLLEVQVNDPNSLLLNGNVTSRVDTTVSPNPEIVVIPLSDDEVANATIAAAGKIAAVRPVSSSITVTEYQERWFVCVFPSKFCSCRK